jgi:alkylated DNA repair dioxygenase AlkB
MSQMPLFGSDCETVLVDDARGRVVYTPSLLPVELARAWFDELREGVPWKSQRRRMYDRDVDVPRLLAHFRLEPGEGSTPRAIRMAARRVIAATGVPFNSVGLNFYRDGRDSVAPHNDHLDEIVEGYPIALLSLGATRRMTIRAKAAPRRVLHVDLTAGSLLVMSYETQQAYTHGIPKIPAPIGPRISLAFRVKPAPDPAEPGPSTADQPSPYGLCTSRDPKPRPGGERSVPGVSMSVSALSSRPRGTVSPRARAVLRLMTSSSLVGSSTGRSAGRAPLKILSAYLAARRYISG